MPRDTYSELADKLRPHFGGTASLAGAGAATTVPAAAAPSFADFVLSLQGSTCHAHDGRTGQLTFAGSDHAAVIQQAVDAAGANGVLAFRAGDYWISAPIKPKNRQAWHCPFGAIFHPTGDHRILEGVGLDLFHCYGTLHIEDTDRRTTSAEAVHLDAAKNCYFQDIFVWDYHRGMTFSGVTGRTFECVFQSIRLLIMRHQGLCLWAEVGDNYFHSVFIKGPSTTEWATGQGLVIGLYPTSNGTVFGGIMFGRAEVLDCQVNIDLQGLYEVWFGAILSDNAYGPALYIGDNVQRLFVDRVWVAGSGDGLWIQGSANSKVRRLFFGSIMAWINAQYGVIFRGRIEGVTIHTLYCLENQVCQLSFQGLENDGITISNLFCADAPAQGMDVDAGGAGANCVIRTAHLTGKRSGLDMLKEVDGVRVGRGAFTARDVATIPASVASVTVLHGLEDRPRFIFLTPYHQEAAGAYIEHRDDYTFTIRIPAAASGDRQVAWQARSGRAPGPELLANPNVDFGGTDPFDWFHSLTTGIEWSAAEYATTPRSIRIFGTTAPHWWQSAAITGIAGGEIYRLRLRVKGAGNNFTVAAVRFWNGAAFLREDRIHLNDNYPAWTERTADFTAPAGTTTAEVAFKTLADLTSDLKFDDVTFNLPAQPNLIADPSAESGGAWQAATAGQVEWVNGDGRTGTRSLRVMPTATADGEWKSNWFVVTGGAAYDASTWVKGTASGNVLFVVRYFSDATGRNQIAEDVREFPGSYPTWTYVPFTFTADSRAQSAEVRLRGSRVGPVDIYADNFSFRQLQ